MYQIFIDERKLTTELMKASLDGPKAMKKFVEQLDKKQNEILKELDEVMIGPNEKLSKFEEKYLAGKFEQPLDDFRKNYQHVSNNSLIVLKKMQDKAKEELVKVQNKKKRNSIF